MKHISYRSEDVPAAAFLMDRRRTPSRRIGWRGGRRDSDWTDRPLGALDRVSEPASRGSALRRMLATLHLW